MCILSFYADKYDVILCFENIFEKPVHKFLPGECVPGECVPGECVPGECVLMRMSTKHKCARLNVMLVTPSRQQSTNSRLNPTVNLEY